MGQSVRASAKGLAIADQARQRRGWTKTSTARWWQDAHTSRATLRRFWRGERIQQDAFMAICQTVGLDSWQEIADRVADSSADVSAGSVPGVDWGTAPDIETFYGREQPLQQLQTWILTDSAKLINIHGLAGNGKTTLALALAEHLQPHFNGVIWRSVNTPLDVLLTDLTDAPIESVNQGVRHLLKKLQNRWLIILDDLEIAQSEPYVEVLYRISRSRHQSCVLAISRQPLPPQFQTLNGSQQLSLSGLSADATVKLLRAYGCNGQIHQLKTLARIYSYNPLALKLVAATIQTIFGGQVAPFLEQETIILPDPLHLLFQQQFETLNLSEKTIIFWLAIWQEPIALCRLQTHLLNANPADAINALTTLTHSGLVTQHFLSDQPSFGLQPMVMTFVIDELVKAIIQEIIQVQDQPTIQSFQLLRTHCLVRPGTDNILGDRILTALRAGYQQQMLSSCHPPLEKWIQLAQAYSPSTIGYLVFNLTALTILLEEL